MSYQDSLNIANMNRQLTNKTHQLRARLNANQTYHNMTGETLLTKIQSFQRDLSFNRMRDESYGLNGEFDSFMNEIDQIISDIDSEILMK